MSDNFAAKPAAAAFVRDFETVPPPAEVVENGISKIEVEEIPECPVCGESRFAKVAVGFDYEIQTCSNPWRIVECEQCSHWWLNPRPALSELAKIYPPTYYAYDFESKVNPIALRGKAFLDRMKLATVFRSLDCRFDSFLDIGCGSGRFLRLAEMKGVQRSNIYGLELDPQVIKRLSAEGYQAFCERVETCNSIPERSISLATMFHVIEHVDDPATVVRKIRKWIRDDGFFVLETPNTESFDARLFKRTFWGGYHIPRHWNLFNSNSITRLLEQNGFSVHAIRYQTGHSFWMYSLHHWVRFGPLKSRKIARIFDPLSGLPMLIAFTGFDKLRSALGFKTSAMLIVARPK